MNDGHQCSPMFLVIALERIWRASMYVETSSIFWSNTKYKEFRIPAVELAEHRLQVVLLKHQLIHIPRVVRYRSLCIRAYLTGLGVRNSLDWLIQIVA